MMIILLVGPSGVGKSSIMSRVLMTTPDLRAIVSCTTRLPRQGERDGVDYRFLRQGEFVDKRRDGEFVEWALVHGHLYGTLRSDFRKFTSNSDLIHDIDFQGARILKQRYPEAVAISILPPSIEVLLERMEKRGDSVEEISKRMRTARVELERIHKFDCVAVNDYLDQVVSRVCEIIDKVKRGERSFLVDYRELELISSLRDQLTRHFVQDQFTRTPKA
jgi:guanylate kinase